MTSVAPGELLFEIGTEEIPAGFLTRALAELPGLLTARLAAARVTHGAVTALGAPRRLTVHVAELAARQTDVSETLNGPPASAAYDKEGKPTRAAQGFAQKIGVPVESLTTVEVAGPKGKVLYVAARRDLVGAPVADLLPALLADLARAIPWKKSMRWASFDEAFVRPVHWIVALHEGQVVPLAIYGVQSGRQTRGHRFLAPGPLDLTGGLEDYRTKLREAFVLVDPDVRKTTIRAELARAQATAGVRVRPDDELLAEVANLVEYPQAVVGSFDTRYLEIPPEVVISAMRGHQRYFATETSDGKLAARFVTIAGTVTRDPDVVRAGNEAVLAARLSDARFFFDEDRGAPLARLEERLGGVIFQKALGTVKEKAERLAAFGPLFSALITDAQLQLAARLCKVDLVTKMVGEFPDLQGVMGSYYGPAWGADAEVATAIVEHYLPRGATDRLPTTALGAALGIADRIDTIVGCFRVGLAPTGSNDAYGLRRAALAILNVLVDRGWRLELSRLVQVAGGNFPGTVPHPPGVAGEILEFFKTRLRGLLVDGRGLPADCVDAALAAGCDDIPDAVARATAVAHLRERPDFEPLGVAFKRVANILKGERVDGVPDAARFGDAERTLWDRYTGVRDEAQRLLDDRAYDAALRELAALKPAIDRFFEDVLVMDPDPAVRENRLRLVGAVAATFHRVADFRQLAVK